MSHALRELQELGGSGGLDEVRGRLGELAGLGGPAPAAVARRALGDSRFAFYLLFTRDSPDLQRRLLDDPRNAEWARQEEDASALALAGNAAKALARWGAGGFRTVDEETRRARLDTCASCPSLGEAPERRIYAGLTLLTGDRRVCSACGCGVARKATLATESCPLGKWEQLAAMASA
jgi:hypothetical protein